MRVAKSATGFLMVLGFVSTNEQLDRNDISNHVSSNLVDPLSRVPGVGNLQVFGSKYAVRIWLDPGKLDTYALSPTDIACRRRSSSKPSSCAAIPMNRCCGSGTLPGSSSARRPTSSRASGGRGDPPVAQGVSPGRRS